MLNPKTSRRITSILQITLLVFTAFTFIFCCVRLNYTTTPRTDKSLFNGASFYDPSVVELLVTTILTLAWVIFLHISVRLQLEHVFLTRVWFEYGMLGFLWLMWVGGAGAASSVWPNLSFCVQYSQCRILQALMGFAWLSWICVTLLAIVAVLDAVAQPDSSRWTKHGHLARKQSLSQGDSGSLSGGLVPRATMAEFRFPAQPSTETV